MTERPEPEYPVAYCAPGALAAAEQSLAEAGEDVATIREHPYLVGQDGVLLVREPPDWDWGYLSTSFVPPTPFPDPRSPCGCYAPDHRIGCPVWWMINGPRVSPQVNPHIVGLPEL